ncbi:MFS general substrate transporter [Mytilinidion resinicola]|uniref:MFS general substrate transporter n=1 Tax=Mytilinidion resinicola TaxID=574789 RepID=A0A6A6Y855_9PEZI|nr:MFS general substrate transporter [Mytilinidion resinicola]KAF2804738.1 MFS general substrate transporter [Mytilinidion resinicola]
MPSTTSRPSTASSTNPARDSRSIDLEKLSSSQLGGPPNTQPPNDGGDVDLEKQKQDLPTRPTTLLSQTRSHRSIAGGDGYTIFPADAGDGDTAPHDYVVTWEGGDSDPLNPRSMSKLRRWVIVIIVSSSSLSVTCASSLYTTTYSQMIPRFHTSREIATLGLSLFVAGLGLGPMVLSPLSEFYGRRPIYIYSFLFFLIWLIPCAVAPNIATMLVGRFLSGLSGSAFLSVAGGTVGDIFAKQDFPFIGPEVGPLIGGFITQYTTWRWSFYVLLIWAGVQLGAIFFLVPETYHPVLLRQKAQRLRKETRNEAWKAPIENLSRSIPKTILWSCIRPFQLLFFEPMCLNLCMLSAILLGILYLFFGAFPLVFQNNHGFSIAQTGLTFLGMFVGMVLGILSDPLWRRNYARLVRQREAHGGEPGGSEPEYRLPPTIVGAFVVPIALFGFGWTTYPWRHLGLLGRLYVPRRLRQSVTHVQYPVYAASALAANSFARSSFAAAFPLFGVQMYNNLGYQWATSLLAFLALAMAPFPILFYRYGKRLRGNSRFASSTTG